MNKPGRPVEIRLELTAEQRRELQQLAREAIGRVSERAHFVLLSGQGKSVPEIAALMGYTAQAIYPWLVRYQQKGIAGLLDEPRSGRPPNERDLVAIVQAQAGQSPSCFGYPEASWSVKGLLRHLRERFKLRVSVSGLRRALPKATFVWGRPKLVLPKGKDPAAETELARLKAVLADPEATILAQDECDMMLLPVLRATWHRRGEQPKVLTPGKNQKRPVFGSVNLRTGAWHYQLTGHKRAVDFIASLEHLLLAYPAGLISVLVDNASIHTAKVVQKWLADHQRLQLVYLPAYAGHKYNPTEKIWWYLKDKVSANRGHKLLVELDQRFWPLILEALEPGSLLIFDLGYTNFAVYAELTAADVRFVTRAKSNLAFKVERDLHRTAEVHDSLVWIGEGETRQLIRLVEVSYQGKWYRYLTNELDTQRLPAPYLVALYWQRWRIEDAYAVVKRLLGLAYFWVGSAELVEVGSTNGVQLQVWSTWLLYAVLIDLTDAVAEQLNQPFAAISLEMVYRGLYHFTQAYHRHEATDPVAYLADHAVSLGVLKRKRKEKQPSPLLMFDLTNRSSP